MHLKGHQLANPQTKHNEQINYLISTQEKTKLSTLKKKVTVLINEEIGSAIG